MTISVVLSACGNLLNFEPITQIDGSTDLKTGLAVNIALNGAYDGLSGRYVWGGETACYSDLLAEEGDIRFRGTFSYMADMWRRDMNTLSAGASEPWLDGYRAINRANRILTVIDTLPSAERASVRGQALFIRAATYFEMVKMFGKAWGDGDNNANPAVPLLLTPSTLFETGIVTDAQKPARNSVAEVYAQIVKDLTDAEGFLPANSDATRANKATAAALLSRVYLLQGNFVGARDAANRVIANTRYSPAATFLECFREELPGFTTETIFRIPVTEQDGVNQLQVFYGAAPGGRRDFEILAAHLNRYETGDVRRSFFFTVGRRLSNKWAPQFGDIPVIRISEMYLTRAECNVRLGTEVGAKPAADVNRIRRRANIPELTDATATLAAILKERSNELAFEGHWLQDKKRTRSNIVTATATYPFNSDKLVFPIPNREIIANSNLKQNPSYID